MLSWLGVCLWSPQAEAQTPFTYQGKLDNGGSPFNGTVGVRLRLFAALEGGSILREETLAGVPVTGGIFTVMPMSFTPADFSGGARWLELAVSSDGTSYTTLSPRQRVASSPLAMYAATAGNAVTATTATVAGTVTGPISGNLNFGASTRQMLNLFNSDYGIGVQTDTLYQRTYNDFSWFQRGTHNNNRNNAGTGGFEMMRLTGYPETGASLLTMPALSGIRMGNASISEGYFGVMNLSAPFYRFNAPIAGGGGTSVMDLGETGIILPAAAKISIGSGFRMQRFLTTSQMQLVSEAIYFSLSDNQNHGYIANGNLVMAGALEGTGAVISRGSNAGLEVWNRNNNSKRWVVYSRNVSGNDRLAFYSDTGSDRATLDTGGNFRVAGALSGNGADVSEAFESSESEAAEPGSVMVIDEENPGKLKLGTEGYDPKVAGIVSGAGGVKPGLLLSQEGVLEGDHQVALSGRVYVKVDAGYGKIRPGDMLTTSPTAGHAMKVKDRGRAQGAVLGKAMGSLEEGTGLVLVLVTLQ